MARSELLMLLFLFGETSAEDVKTVSPGDDVTLPCWSADPNIRTVQWTRTDLKPENIFSSTDGHFNPEEQHPSFQGRVQLVDRGLKDGDVSLILKNMKSSDKGTYECRVKVAGSSRRKRDISETEPIRRVRLQVKDPELIPVNPGDDVTLTCRSADPNIRAVQWTRTDLKSENVFLSTDGHFKPEEQHPSFKGRVQLVERDLKDGDVSLTLKNMTRNDEGTYECRVKVAGSTRRKRDISETEPIRRFRLEVAGRTNIGLIAAVFLVCSSLVGVGVGVMKSKRRLNNDPEAPAAAEAERVELNTSQT